MIHVFIGTKAQYIKTAPVCRELTRRGVIWRLIDSGQHRGLSEAL
ncbi:MAG: UDP-N-acetylglucosamine 2-epimerase, partial [Planctomycetes bacterium]|nr:UDP-N-acetylglucosamine 2-epimerase [Planctomycetota bacterium]